MLRIDEARIAILATDGRERFDLREPPEKLGARGVRVEIMSFEPRKIRSREGRDWGNSIAVSRDLSAVAVDAFDAFVLPGGRITTDMLRVNGPSANFVRKSGRAARSGGNLPWAMAPRGSKPERGRAIASFAAIRTDVANAGGIREDSPVVTGQESITSRKPDDLPAFINRIAEEIERGWHDRAGAA